MLIGPSGSGKTTLAAALNGQTGPVKRTQNMIYGEKTLDVPGVYLECPWMHKHIIAAAQDASHVLMLVPHSCGRLCYPPGFANAFRVPVIGVIIGNRAEKEKEEFCIRQLEQTGVPIPYSYVDLSDYTGLKALQKQIKETERREREWNNLL